MNLKHNINHTEKNIRVIFGVLCIIIALIFSIPWLALFAIIPLVTSAYNYCPIYDATNINEDEAKKNYYLAHFPKYNPEPIMLFLEDHSIDFKNAAAREIFTEIKTLEEIYPKDDITIEELINTQESVFNKIQINNLVYIIHFKGVKELGSVLAFAFNITEIEKINAEIIDTQKDIVYTMGEIGETRSKETGNHVKRVAEYSYLLARLYGIKEDKANILKIASPMHDIGKVGIPDEVLKKPGRLNASEWEVMRTHSIIGYEMLKSSSRPILQAAAIVAKEHHEKWDGSGYPHNLSGESIHIYGRITAIADVFDALGSKRVYKDAWELEKVLDFFKEQRGKHFDPKLVDLFFDNLDDFLKIRDKYQDV